MVARPRKCGNVVGMKYRKKPVIIEAMRFDSPEAAERIREWSGGLVHPHEGDPTPERPSLLVIGTFAVLRRPVSLGDWVIREGEGRYHPCPPELFEATYEPVKHEYEKEGLA